MARIKSFFDGVRQRAKYERRVITPGGDPEANWPLCLTCNGPVDATELKNVNAHGCELWARCHGAEDWYEVRFPFRLDGDPLEDERANWAIQRAMKDTCFFDPTQPAK